MNIRKAIAFTTWRVQLEKKKLDKFVREIKHEIEQIEESKSSARRAEREELLRINTLLITHGHMPPFATLKDAREHAERMAKDLGLDPTEFLSTDPVEFTS